MQSVKLRNSGWQGVALVAITYVYFLIFAQFAFLGRMAALGIAGTHLKAVMASMAVGGVVLSLLVPRSRLLRSPALRLRVGFGACGAAAWLALLPLDTVAGMAVALLIGASLGLTTVTLVTHLRQWCGDGQPIYRVALGTGIGYLLCNFPPFFTAVPAVQASVAGLLCLAGVFIVPGKPILELLETPSQVRMRFSFPLVLACFAALVWLDSAAFYIIQHTPTLKTGTWSGATHLWANGILHLGAALAAAWVLRRRGLLFLLAASFFALGGACLLLLEPGRMLLASVLYPVGVSLYSVALVAYPSLLAPVGGATAVRARQAGWLYAVAGWVGSALGIGMGQNLGHVPPAFVAAAGAVILSPWLFLLVRRRAHEVALTAAVFLIALAIYGVEQTQDVSAALTPVERGRQVYISEGCINCHSQYVRPHTRDELLWGPEQSLATLQAEQPPLIGNRRQGPDLSEVGLRRSPLWLKAHLYHPRQVSGASIMPSYAFLFSDRRGADLVAYLASLRSVHAGQHLAEETTWVPAQAARDAANVAEGRRLYARYCATCHNSDGQTRDAWKSSFARLPANLSRGPFFYLHPDQPALLQRLRIARIAKFGIPGTDMPGHEWLGDRQIASISLWLARNMAPPEQTHPHLISLGDK